MITVEAKLTGHDGDGRERVSRITCECGAVFRVSTTVVNVTFPVNCPKCNKEHLIKHLAVQIPQVELRYLIRGLD